MNVLKLRGAQQRVCVIFGFAYVDGVFADANSVIEVGVPTLYANSANHHHRSITPCQRQSGNHN